MQYANEEKIQRIVYGLISIGFIGCLLMGCDFQSYPSHLDPVCDRIASQQSYDLESFQKEYDICIEDKYPKPCTTSACNEYGEEIWKPSDNGHYEDLNR